MTQAVVDRKPISAQLLRRGRRALRAGQRMEARRYLQRALAADPFNEQAWLWLARLGTPHARLAYAVKALELNASSLRAWDELRRARLLIAPPASRTSDPHLALLLRAFIGLGRWILALLLAGGLMGWLPGALRSQRRPSNTAAFTSTANPTSTPVPTPIPVPPTATPEPPRPTQAPAPQADDERWIDINLTNQTLTAYEGQTQLYTFLVSTGIWQYPTLTGQFRIYVKYASAPMAGPGYDLASVPYVMYFYQGYGLHGTYWHNNFGHPMSHGCVNLRTEDAAWLFDWASIGTLVNIHN